MPQNPQNAGFYTIHPRASGVLKLGEVGGTFRVPMSETVPKRFAPNAYAMHDSRFIF